MWFKFEIKFKSLDFCEKANEFYLILKKKN